MISEDQLEGYDASIERLVIFCGEALSEEEFQAQLRIRKLTAVLARFCSYDTQMQAIRRGDMSTIDISPEQKKLFAKLQILCNIKRFSLKLGPVFNIVQLSPRLMCIDDATFEMCKSVWDPPNTAKLTSLVSFQEESSSTSVKTKKKKKKKSTKESKHRPHSELKSDCFNVSGGGLTISTEGDDFKKGELNFTRHTNAAYVPSTPPSSAGEGNSVEDIISSFQAQISTAAGSGHISSDFASDNDLCNSGDWCTVRGRKKGRTSTSFKEQSTRTNRSTRSAAAPTGWVLSKSVTPTPAMKHGVMTSDQTGEVTSGANGKGVASSAKITFPVGASPPCNDIVLQTETAAERKGSAAVYANKQDPTVELSAVSVDCAANHLTTFSPDDCCRKVLEDARRVHQSEIDELQLKHEAEICNLREAHYQAMQTANLRLFISNNALEIERQDRAKLIEQAVSEYISSVANRQCHVVEEGT